MNNKFQNIKNIDKNNFFKDLKDFPKQIEYIINNRTIFDKINKVSQYSNILICGMGGSGISGDLLKSVFQDNIKLPIIINKDYGIPNFVSNGTLIILSSYSGNTEEILSCFDSCIENNYSPIILANNGQLLVKAKENNLQYVKIPGGLMPRAALGYSITILIKILHRFNILNDETLNDLENSISYLKADSTKYSNLDIKENTSMVMAKKCYNKFNIIYTSSKMEVVGMIFRAQLSENSKILSSHFIFPEQNHNEIEAFTNSNINKINIIWINDISLNDKVKKRMKITSRILNDFAENQFVEFTGPSFLLRELRLIYFLDWVSFYCAMLLETNPYPIDKIKQLKSLL